VRARLTEAQFTRVRHDILWRGTLLVTPVAAGLSIYNGLWQPVVHFSHLHQVVANLIQSAVIIAVIVVGSDLVLKVWLRRHARWAVGDAEPDDADRLDLAQLPIRTALTILAVVLATTAATAVVSVIIGTPAVAALGIGLGFFVTGFTYALIVYLQTERSLRPLYAMALTDSVMPDRRFIGVRPRLYVTWLLGSAGPLVFILAIPLRATKGDQLPILVPMLYMASVGLLLGAMTVLLTGRSVAEPVTQVRRGLQKVGAGDLDTELEVTNPGDLGQLQAGFNAMVKGLRERRELEDLFGRHVGEQVARQALQSGVDLGGELRLVTALFVDIIGSTAFAETNPPQVVVARVNELFQTVFDVVSGTGGWINKFEGDGCLCVFGAPTVLPDHVAHGLRAARTLGQRLAVLGLDVGIGVACGEVVAGNIGSVERFEYTVIGRPINEAARLTEAAKLHPAHVLATLDAINTAGDEGANWEPDAELELRGITLPVAVAHPKSEPGNESE
jgi:class 3 adenylate cyclase